MTITESIKQCIGEATELDDAIKGAKSASASISDGSFSSFIKGKIKKKGRDIFIQDGVNVISFPDSYVRDFEDKGGVLTIILKTL